MLRLVFDTNVWLDWLVFDDPSVAPVKMAVAEGRAKVFIDDAVEAELVRVLGYPFGARSLDAQAQAKAVAECLRVATKGKGEREKGKESTHEPRSTPVLSQVEGTHSTSAERNALPKCKDPDDQKFLELALACGAEFLVTRDAALLELKRNRSRPLPYRVVTPKELNTELAR